jgi:WD40 repeat protein
LLRVDIARSECNCVAVPADGLVILTGWADGRIRGYLPQSGKELWVINEAHLNGVTAITCSGDRAIAGGETGDICVWQLNAKTRNLVKTPKEHHQEVTQIRFSKDGNEFVSRAHDGSVILWDTNRLTSRQRFLARPSSTGQTCTPRPEYW